MPDFSRTHRLTSKQEFQFVFARSNKVAHANLTALYRPNQKQNARLGIVIGKHHVKLAVERNNIRRIIRESFRQQKETLKGLDIVVVIRSECIAVAHPGFTPSGLLRNKKALRDDINTIWRLISKKAY